MDAAVSFPLRSVGSVERGRARLSFQRARPLEFVMSDENEVDIRARDRRIALHEAAHLTVGRACGAPYGGATIQENLELGYSGLCWGPDYSPRSHFTGQTTTNSVIEQLDKLKPRDGEARDDDTAFIFQHVVSRVTELTAGSEAELLHLGDAWEATDDRKQERQLAALIYSSPEAQAIFIEACRVEARAILHRQADVLEALAAALLEHRTLDAQMIDDVISRAVAARQLAEERERRRRWDETIARANSFTEQHCV
jgi:hypothetical protein